MTSEAAINDVSISAAAAPADASNAARNRLVIALLLVSTFVVFLNETIMSVAIPHLMTDLGVTAGAAQWLTTAFLLTMAVVIPITGFLLQRINTRPIYMLAMAIFSVGTLICAVSPGLELLVFGRVVQAVGTAIMMPLLMTTVMTLVPPESRGKTMGNISIVMSVAPAIGPTIGGFILTHFDWRFMFILVLPIALAALALGAWRMKNVSTPRSTPLDLISVVLSVLACLTVFFKFSRFWSVRNIDLLLLFVLVPGILLILGRPGNVPEKAYIWLFVGSGLWMVRCLLDLGLTRRPLLEPNLNAPGLLCLSIGLLGLMLAETVDPLGSDRLVLIGHSMGVQWVIEAAAHLGDAVRSVVLIGPVVDDAHRSMAAQARALAIDTMGESSLINAIVVTDYLRCGIRWYLRQVRHMVAYPTLERIRMLAVPVLVIRGSRDPVTGRRWCRRLVSAASNARLVEVPGQHHVVQHSAPRAVAGAIREHLDRTVSGLREDARRGSGC